MGLQAGGRWLTSLTRKAQVFINVDQSRINRTLSVKNKIFWMLQIAFVITFFVFKKVEIVLFELSSFPKIILLTHVHWPMYVDQQTDSYTCMGPHACNIKHTNIGPYTCIVPLTCVNRTCIICAELSANLHWLNISHTCAGLVW